MSHYEHKNMKIFIDEAIDHRNKNMGGELTRNDLGKMIFPEYSENTIKAALSKWNSGILSPQPDAWQLKHMALICGVSVDFLLGVTDMPQRYENLPARMLTALLVCEQELQKHYNLDESPALQGIQTIKEKLS